ncbi:hypothetical protein PFISCL1PPCAC_8242, partial [Pristionchus fissidentatus]
EKRDWSERKERERKDGRHCNVRPGVIPTHFFHLHTTGSVFLLCSFRFHSDRPLSLLLCRWVQSLHGLSGRLLRRATTRSSQ